MNILLTIRRYLETARVYVVHVAHLDRMAPLEAKLVVAGILLLAFAPVALIVSHQATQEDTQPEGVIPLDSSYESPLYEAEGEDGSGSSTGESGGAAGGSSGQRGQAGGTSSGSSRTSGGDGMSRGGGGGSSNNSPASPTTPPKMFESYCLARSGQVINLSGLQKGRVTRYSITPNTIFNAKNIYWDGTDTAGRPVNWPLGFDGTGPACWYGGRYQGVWDDTNANVTWGNTYHHAGAMNIRMGNFLAEGFRADNQGDGITMTHAGATFHIRGVHLSNMHDDCVENDALYSGITEDSFFNGCYSGFSADSHNDSSNGSNNTWLIENNLLRMKPFPTVHRVSYFTDRGCSLPNHMHIFKGWWRPASPGPKVVLKNNIFKFDIRPCDTYPVIPPGMPLAQCSNNIIVYTGPGNFPQPIPPCFTITRDASVWNNAVTKWKQTHPDAN